jgi:uncharacterized protein
MTRSSLKWIWTLCLVAAGVLIIALPSPEGRPSPEIGLWLAAALFGIAFLGEYVDSTLGMGYGTTLTPLLLVMGFSPLQVVPAVLLSELFSGLFAGVLHHKMGNVDLGKGSPARRLALTLALCSILGVTGAVFLALNLPPQTVKIYIGIMVLGIGVLLLLGKGMASRWSPSHILGLGVVAAFNKGISGGGYGPLLTGGQMLSGVPEKTAIGVTSLAEGLVCIVGLSVYLLLHGWPNWELAACLTLGAVLSVPAAAITVKILPAFLLRRSVGYATVFLGAVTLIKLV